MTQDPNLQPSAAQLSAFARLRIDAAAVELIGALRQAGIESVLLKGRTIAGWLYDRDETRSYVDSDVLVRAGEQAGAERVLESLGFQRERDLSWIAGWANPAQPWLRSVDGALVDLHVGIPGVGVDSERLWQVLEAELEPMAIAGAEVMVLSPAARALHLALHVSQHEANLPRHVRDLERALARLDRVTWRSAGELAHRLDAVPALVLGLQSVPAGVELARQLGLPSRRQALHAIQTARMKASLRALSATPSISTRVRMLASKVVPSTPFMRNWSPLARRGPIGLALAYPWRLVWLTGRALMALRGRGSRID